MIRRYLPVIFLLIFVPSQALALTAADQQSLIDGTEYYWAGQDSASCSSDGSQSLPISGSTLVRFLQALAYEESGGNPKATSVTGASGKYQYLDSTWQGVTQSDYPPAAVYSSASDAPEDMQDATAYLEFAKKFKTFNGDLFKLAVSHFYPAANDDPSLLDVIPPGNVVTPRQYADTLINNVNKGVGSNIPMLEANAPDFSTLAQQEGAPDPSTSAQASALDTTCPTGNGAVAGNIVQTAENLAWPNDIGHTAPDSATPSYKAAWAQYDGQSDMTDCGAFVATVMRSSGVDPNYPKVGTDVQEAYLESSGKYTIINHPTSTSQLLPGDIMIYDVGGEGHTFIYTGPQSGGYVADSASLGDHTPQAEPPGEVSWIMQQPNEIAARVK